MKSFYHYQRQDSLSFGVKKPFDKYKLPSTVTIFASFTVCTLCIVQILAKNVGWLHEQEILPLSPTLDKP